jgi:serine/threonine protein kinase
MVDYETRKQQSLSKFCIKCGDKFASGMTKCPKDGGELMELRQDMIGTTFAKKYQITSILGEGGMSIVYKAKHKYMERVVAVKVLHKHLVADAVALQRFQQESQAASSLSHPNIVTVYDFGIEEGQAFFVMDCLEGPTLQDVLEKQERISPKEAVSILVQLCDGLEHAHRKGIVHRDLKPSNVVLMPQENGSQLLKIVDFGIAKLMPSEDGKTRQSLTQTGEVFGSPLFMSPEQCMGRAPDLRSDIYSVGCLMYEALSGVPPLMGDTSFETMTKHVNEMPLTFKQIGNDLQVPPELEAVVFRCLQKDPENRYQSAAEIIGDLPDTERPAIRNITIHPNAQLKPAVKKPTFVFPTTVVLALTVTAVSSYYLFFWKGPLSDNGTPYHKFRWNVFLTLADSAAKADRNQDAAHYLLEAEKETKFISDRQEKYLKTLSQQAEIYGRLAENDKVDEVTQKIAEVKKERAQGDLDRLSKILEAAKTSSSINKNMNDAVVNFNNVRELAAALHEFGLFSQEEDLLSSAAEVYKRALPPNDPQLGDLDSALGRCYESQQKMDSAGEYFRAANEIYKKAAPGSIKSTKGLLELAIFEKDQSHWDASKQYLTGALEQARKLTDTQLLSQCLNAYGDWFKQQNHPKEAKQYFDEAQSVTHKKL